MPITQHIFREYDIRGLMDTEIDFVFVQRLGQVLAEYFKKNGHHRVLIGYDTRKNSIDYHNILCDELNKNGCDVISLGMIPSPCLYFAVHHLQIFAGIMVTASHNDAPYNGFKIWEGKSTLYGENIQYIYQRMLAKYNETKKNTLLVQSNSTSDISHAKSSSQTKNISQAENLEIQGISSYFDIKTPYSKNIYDQIGKLSCKVVVDGANASAGELCCCILQKMSVEFIPLYCEPTSDFPNHPPDPTIAEHCAELCKKIIQHDADYGIGLDGDGDRVVMVDRNARILACDELLSVLARDMIMRIPNARILADVKCTQHLFQEIEGLGATAIMSPTGHSLMKAAMQKEKAHIGGELSGHFFHAENWFGTDDGILTAVRVLAILRDRKWDLTQFPMWEKSYASPEIRFACPEDKKNLLIKKAQEFYVNKYRQGEKDNSTNNSNEKNKQRNSSSEKDDQASNSNEKIKIACIDGVRVDFSSSWFLIRASNTSAALTLRFEADSQEALNKLKSTQMQRLDTWLNELS